VADEVTRRSFLERTGAAALGAAGVYALVDALAGEEVAAAAAERTRPPAPEQHVLRDVRAVTDDGVRVLVPPLHHQVVTAKLRVGRSRADLLEARHELERALRRLDRRFPPSARGLGYSVGWGHSYFRERVPRLRDGRRYADYLPIDNRASEAAGRPVPAFLEAIRFPSDPDDVILEENDVCVQFRSDSLDRIAAGADAIFGELRDVFALTSVRKGFVGGGASRSRPGFPRRPRSPRRRSSSSASPAPSRGRSAPSRSRTSRPSPGSPTSGRTATSAAARRSTSPTSSRTSSSGTG
jgi:hypothetical protein